MAGAADVSYFDGNTLQRIGWRILSFLLAVITLGIAYPWAMCMMVRWEISHTVINGRRLKFTGYGHQLFGRYILWAFLTVITLGIYSIWFGLGMKKWVVRHTVYADDKSGVESRFTGGAGGWFGYHLLFGLIAVVTLGIGIPWGQRMLLRWEAEHTEIGGSALIFSGTGGQLFVKYLVFVLLTPLTLGIYALFFPVSLLKWQISHTAWLGTPGPARKASARQISPTARGYSPGAPGPARKTSERQGSPAARGKGPAPAKKASRGSVVVVIVVLAVIVVFGGIGVVLAWTASVPRYSAETSEPPQTALSVEEFEQLLMGVWSNARREDDVIYTLHYAFLAGGEFELGTGAYDNIHKTHFPDEEGDEYGWYIAPMGHPSFYGNYSLDASGDGRFTLTVTGSYDFSSDFLEQYTSELTYVDDNTILIDGVTYVRGSYTLAEYAGIFGFDIEVVDDVVDDPLW